MIRSTQLIVEAARSIRNQILTKKMPSGLHLVENDVAVMLQVSRGTLREAMKILELEGLVQTRSNGHTVVVGITPDDIQDLFLFRNHLEQLGLELAVQNAQKDEFNAVREILGQMREGKETENADISFHRSLVRMSHNRFLVISWENMSELFKGLLSITNQLFGRWDGIIEEHEAIVHYIEIGNCKLASETLSIHLAAARKLMLQLYSEI
ncbi:MAG: GntR family transcriptional regulator [Bacilli bacterium]